VIGIAQNGTLLAYTVPSATVLQNASFQYGSTFYNVTLLAGANAQIWAGIRGGYFAALSTSSSLTWQEPPTAVAGAAVAPVNVSPQPQAAQPQAEQSTVIAMPRYDKLLCPAFRCPCCDTTASIWHPCSALM
jgi:hypothetical protein